MSEHKTKFSFERFYDKRFLPYYVGGAACLLLVCGAIFYSIIIGKTRREPAPAVAQVLVVPTSTESELVARHLDGVMVPVGQEAFKPRAVMVDNMVDARPWSGISDASIVIEAPAEGGITRFLTLFDGGTSTTKIGPIRSARPYYLDWVRGWDAAYFHVGGSPEAIETLKQLGPTFANIDEIARGQYFWRATDRYAPHNTYTSADLMTQALDRLGFASSTFHQAWHFQDLATFTERGTVATIRVAYGGSYNVNWTFDAERDVYTRLSGTKVQKEAEGNAIEVQNVIVLKTESQVLDEKGRLRVRTTGNGDAVAYRDGSRYALRWRRVAGEPIRFETADGREFLFARGKTWIHVTTNDLAFGGVE